LADEFRRTYPATQGYRVFSRGHDRNKAAFGLNEYLYDITVVRVDTVPSATKKAQLEYPVETLWHVECEFNENNSRASIVDFGKLLMSGAQYKLLILPAGGRIERWARAHLNRPRASVGETYLAFVPHPRVWSLDGEQIVKVLQLP
jgi:hypothetical protein